MFLKMKTLLILTVTFFSVSALAHKISVLEAGKYELTSGPKTFCDNFVRLTEKDAEAKSIAVGVLYTYETLNSTYSIESDIDPNCRFLENNLRENHDDMETVLTRINEETCNGHLRSRTTSILTIRRGELQIRHTVDGAGPYTCIWKKQQPKN